MRWPINHANKSEVGRVNLIGAIVLTTVESTVILVADNASALLAIIENSLLAKWLKYTRLYVWL